jgi:hypothetical protein
LRLRRKILEITVRFIRITTSYFVAFLALIGAARRRQPRRVGLNAARHLTYENRVRSHPREFMGQFGVADIVSYYATETMAYIASLLTAPEARLAFL